MCSVCQDIYIYIYIYNKKDTFISTYMSAIKTEKSIINMSSHYVGSHEHLFESHILCLSRIICFLAARCSKTSVGRPFAVW